jgi:hypothetical protein
MGVPILHILAEERDNLVIFTHLCVRAINETPISASVIRSSFLH